VRRFALEQIARLLERLALEVEHARSAREPEAIHDLRVTIRRFGRSLRAFSPFVPASVAKRVRKQLRHIMDLTGEVRNRDITLELLDKAEVAEPVTQVKSDRELAMRILVSELERWQVENEAVRWRAALELPAS
jgi:CHAD domain-containing protein